MLYSKTTGGFYSRDFHGENVPADVVEISDADYRALTNSGKQIQPDANGLPVAVDAPSDDAVDARAWRDEQLRLADIEINKLEDNGQDATAWRQYRQALRDVPALKGFPTKFNRPVAPA